NGTYTAEVGSERLSVEITTDYPHDGRITLRVVEAPEVAASLSVRIPAWAGSALRSEEHTSELQSRFDLVCRLLLEKKNKRAYRRGIILPAKTQVYLVTSSLWSLQKNPRCS